MFVPCKEDEPIYVILYNKKKDTEVISTFKAKINKFHSVLTYLPISFDSF